MSVFLTFLLIGANEDVCSVPFLPSPASSSVLPLPAAVSTAWDLIPTRAEQGAAQYPASASTTCGTGYLVQHVGWGLDYGALQTTCLAPLL